MKWTSQPVFMAVLAIGVSCANVQAQTPAASESPVDLVRRTVENEINSPNGSAKFMFRDRKETTHGTQTKLLVETTETMVGLIVANDDHPLSPQERQAEQARVERFLKDPEEIKKRARREKEDVQHTNRIMRALPDAFVYEADGAEAGTPELGKIGDQLVRLKFKPNPHYVPPGREEQVLAGLQGEMLIDTNQHRIAKIEGALFQDVEFGWGILGRLNKGGTFLVQQADVDDGHWEVTRMRLSFDGKIVMVKSLVIRSNEIFTDFREVPATLNYAQGLELLEKQQADLAENQHADAIAK